MVQSKRIIPLIYISLTEVHYGDVPTPASIADLPIYRDSFGNIVLRGEGIKGAIRSQLTLRENVDKEIIKALFGPEPGEREKAWRGIIEFLDAFLLFIPVMSGHTRIAYITTPSLIARAAMFLDVAYWGGGKLKEVLGRMAVDADKLLDISTALSSRNTQQGLYNVAGEITLLNVPHPIAYALKDFINVLLEKADLKEIITDDDFDVLIVHDRTFQIILSKAILIRPGVKLKGFNDSGVYQKVVDTGPWFEEELPPFSIFIGGVSTRIKEEFPFDLYGIIIKLGELGFNRIEILNKSLNSSDKWVKIPIGEIKNFIERYASIIQLGANETLAKGILQILTITKDIRIEYQSQSSNNVQTIKPRPLIIEKYSTSLKEIIEKTSEFGIPNKADEVKGKLSSLPERIGRLGLIPTYMFYTKTKRDAEGKGYVEIIKLLEIINEKIFSENFEELSRKIIFGKARRDDIAHFLLAYKRVLDLITRLKYIGRAYATG